ncbi:MAG: acetylxylan esterase [Candidatus Bathyarchaeia archaeon]
MDLQELLSFYPSLDEVEDYWREAVCEIPESIKPEEVIDQTQRVYPNPCDYHIGGGVWLKFRGLDGKPFWCLWQKCPRPGVRKALIHLPGYGTEVSVHPSLVHNGYHVLHINPRGYCGPEGFGNREWREADGLARVIYLNLENPKKYGYRLWFQDAIIALRWLQKQNEVDRKIGFYGTSQGGGASLILGSILSDEGIVGAVAADVPFLTNFPREFLKEKRSTAYDMVFTRLPKDADGFKKCFHTLGFIDTIVHAPRMRHPVLLTAGERDDICPYDLIFSLYEKLPSTRAITEFHGQTHAYTPNFLVLAKTWFDLYL